MVFKDGHVWRHGTLAPADGTPEAAFSMNLGGVLGWGRVFSTVFSLGAHQSYALRGITLVCFHPEDQGATKHSEYGRWGRPAWARALRADGSALGNFAVSPSARLQTAATIAPAPWGCRVSGALRTVTDVTSW